NFFSEAYAQYHDKLVKDAVVVLTGEVGEDRFNGGLKITVRNLQTLDEVRQERADSLVLRLQQPAAGVRLVEQLAEALHPRDHNGCPVRIEYTGAGARGVLVLGEAWRVKPTDELLRRLRDCLGPEAVALSYDGA